MEAKENLLFNYAFYKNYHKYTDAQINRNFPIFVHF